MLVRVLRALLVAAAIVGIAVAVSALTGAPRWATTLAGFVAVVVVYVWLPRVAHRSFRRGRFGRAELYYRVLRPVLLSRAARASVDVSVAACALGRSQWDRALERLERIDPDRLGEASRAALLNNRAYALARAGRDADAAVEACEQALTLRPDVIGFRHTRGVALLAAGRVDEAIRTLDQLWTELSGQDTPLLEAERCYDLGVAWSSKGEPEYATDYFERAHRAAPDSRWASLAASRLTKTPVDPQLGELL